MSVITFKAALKCEFKHKTAETLSCSFLFSLRFDREKVEADVENIWRATHMTSPRILVTETKSNTEGDKTSELCGNFQASLHSGSD